MLMELVLFVIISGCANESKDLEEVTKQVNINTSDPFKVDTTKSIKIDMTTETRHSYIKEVFVNNSKLYIKADYVDYFTDDEAAEAEWRDKAYMIIDGDTMTGITDGYYISNQNDKLRIFKLSKDVEINIFFVARDSYEFEEIKGASLSQFKEHLENNPLLILHIEEGIVVGIKEQFIP